jgi:hypothetical protein
VLGLTLALLSDSVEIQPTTMRILFVASEGLPYVKTGGLADVIEALPKALVKLGHEVAVFLPRYRGVKSNSVVMPSMTIPQGFRLRFPEIPTTLTAIRFTAIKPGIIPITPSATRNFRVRRSSWLSTSGHRT